MPTQTPPVPPFDLNDVTTLRLDLGCIRRSHLAALIETLEDEIRALEGGAPKPLNITPGLNEVAPELARDLLLRNRRGANRDVDAGTVYFYGRQMARGDWAETHLGIGLNTDGHLIDGQHRLLAILISGVTIRTAIIPDVPVRPNLFAYLDNGRQRTARTTLQIAGLNGVSSTIARAVRIAEEVRTGAYSPSRGDRLPRLSNAAVLELAHQYPTAQRASRSAASEWSDAVSYLGGRKAVVAYLGMAIIDGHSEARADDFFEEMVEEDLTAEPGDPMLSLRQLLARDKKKRERGEKGLKPQVLLADLITVFNAWHLGELLPKRWEVGAAEDFPVLICDPHADDPEDDDAE